jgi:queuine tRNA-ribosyltransferase
MRKFKYTLLHSDGLARRGLILTAHGKIETPAFMPVGTRATVKTMDPRELSEIEAQIILGNTYHLYLKPGDKLIKKMGGLHKFMGWDGPILTDSGGFQVFSLGKGAQKESLVKIHGDKVEFRSHIDGKKHIFTPKGVLDIQNNLGSDIAMVLDECAPGVSDYEYAKQAMVRTHDWAKEAKEYATKKKFDMAVFGIVQGVTYDDLRSESAKHIDSLDFDGNAIGGLAVGESKKDMYRTLSVVTPLLSELKPRYLMGVGTPEDILEAVERGVDMFDCVHPTRIARNGAILTFSGQMNMNNAKFTEDKKPMEPGCDCYACQNFSRSYVRHLLNVDEILGIRLTTIHNLRFMMRFMAEIRAAITENRFKKFKNSFLKTYKTK